MLATRQAGTTMLSGCLLILLMQHAATVGAFNRCGTSFADAGTKCIPCPNGVDSDCPAGNKCYADLPDCQDGGSPVPPQQPPSPDSGNNGVTCSSDEFNNAITSCGFGTQPDSKRQDMLSSIAKLGGDQVISSKRELAMWMAQIIHESAGLSTISEIDGPSKPYAPYYGRGYLQLTGIDNYRTVSRAIYGDDRLVDNPDLITGDDNIAFDVSTYYWRTRVHNLAGVQDGQFGQTTVGINGGECTANPSVACTRCNYYKKVLVAFGINETANCAGCANC